MKGRAAGACRARWAAGLAGAAALAGAGCGADPEKGYVFSSAHDASIASINVPMFTNNTFAHGIESELTDAIVKQLKQATPWKVTSQGTAQTTLSGKIIEARLLPMSLGRVSGIVQEQAVMLTIEFEWKDNRTGKVLASRRNFSASEIFVPAQGVQERVEVGQEAAIQKLARGVVDELRSGW